MASPASPVRAPCASDAPASRSNRSHAQCHQSDCHSHHSSHHETNEAHDQEQDRALSPLEALPLTLFHDIMGFALSCAHKSTTQQRTAAESDLKEIALVSKAVRTHATEIDGQIALGKLCLWIVSGTRREILSLRRDVLYCRVYLREIHVNSFPPTELQGSEAHEWIEHVVPQIATLVSLAPQLEVLDLSACCGDVSTIIEAAARNCPQLQSLVLPMDHHEDEDGHFEEVVDMEPAMDALCAGLAQWHKRAGGLRQLRVPSREAISFEHSTTFFRQVIQYCPKVEIFDAAVSQWNLDDEMDEWWVDRAVWRQFCETCSALREFDWATVPWATEFFDIFAQYPKKKLSSLILKTTMQWDWGAYLDQVGREDAAAIKVSGYGATATGVHRVLEACPALKRLTIVANSNVSNDDETLDTMVELEEYEDRPAPLPYIEENDMNRELFGDEFCRALVRHCPLLEEFSLMEDHDVLAMSMRRMRPVMRFEDGAMTALAQLQHLSSLTLKAVNISGKGLFTLVSALASESHGTRCYKLRVGDRSQPRKFYELMQEFFHAMLKAKTKDVIASKRIHLCVTNSSRTHVEKHLSKMYLERYKDKIQELRRQYPTITFRIHAEELTNTTFMKIYRFGLYTAPATLPLDSPWLDIPEDALEDDVFIKEEMMDDYVEDNGDYQEGDEDYGSLQDYDSHQDYSSGEDYDSSSDRNHSGGYSRRPVTFIDGVEMPNVGDLEIHDQHTVYDSDVFGTGSDDHYGDDTQDGLDDGYW